MTISFVAGDAVAADTLTLPSLTIGDTIIGIGLAPAASSVSITVPSQWWQPQVSAVSAGRSRALAIKVVDDVSFSFGTWTTAEKTAYLIFRGTDGIVYPQNLSAGTLGTGTTLSHPAINSAAFIVNANDIRMVLLASANIVGNGAEAAVSGYTRLLRNTVASNDLVVDCSDALLSSFATTTRTMASNTNTFGMSIMLKEIPFIVPTGGGSTTHNPFRSRAFGGGPRT